MKGTPIVRQLYAQVMKGLPTDRSGVLATASGAGGADGASRTLSPAHTLNGGLAAASPLVRYLALLRCSLHHPRRNPPKRRAARGPPPPPPARHPPPDLFTQTYTATTFERRYIVPADNLDCVQRFNRGCASLGCVYKGVKLRCSCEAKRRRATLRTNSC
jgi:hypothetical protein